MLAGLVVATILLIFLFFVDILYPLSLYAPGQIINPVRLAYYVALAGFFFLIVRETPTLSGSLTWLLLLLTVYDLGYIGNFLTNVIIRPGSLGLGDWVTIPMFSFALFACTLAWVKHVSIKAAVRIVIGVSLLSIFGTFILYVMYDGLVVGTGRALTSGLVGPFTALLGTASRARGDWATRESHGDWRSSKHMDSEDWTRTEEEIVKADIDSYDKTSRETTIHICHMSSGEKCEDMVLKISGNLGNLVWDEIDEYNGKDARISFKDGEINAISFWGVPKRDDPIIFEVVKKLSSQLDVPEVSSNWIFWKERSMPVSIWLGLTGPPYWLQLDERLARELSPSEWEPLIMSTLILQKTTTRKRILSLAQYFLIISISNLLLFPILDFVVLHNFLGATLREILLFGAFVCSLILIDMMKIVRQTRLDADRMTAEKVGKTRLLELFTKVQRHTPDHRGLVIGKLLHLFESEPSTEERVQAILRA